jgi:hypothetical protein
MFVKPAPSSKFRYLKFRLLLEVVALNSGCASQMAKCGFKQAFFYYIKPRWRSRYSDSVRTGRSGFRVPVEAREFFFLRYVRTGSGPTYAVIECDPGYSFRLEGGGGEWRRGGWWSVEVDHSSISGAEVNNEWIDTSSPHICPNGMDRDSLGLCWITACNRPIVHLQDDGWMNE